MQQLDLCCGKGEMLCQWSAQAGLRGIGVDISLVFLEAARQRAVELDCANRITFVEADARMYAITPGAFDIVSCIVATWIGNGLVGTLKLMRRRARLMQPSRTATATCSPHLPEPRSGLPQRGSSWWR